MGPGLDIVNLPKPESVDDIRALAHPVLRHRILLNFQAQSERVSSDDVVERLLKTVPVPSSGM
mgnify:CR=1 FL=1